MLCLLTSKAALLGPRLSAGKREHSPLAETGFVTAGVGSRATLPKNNLHLRDKILALGDNVPIFRPLS
jgi:hypothetical protein